MSAALRDTGWRDNCRVLSDDKLDVRIRLTVWPGAGFFVVGDFNFADGGVLDIDAKRAAEDALRKLCRDTLAALGEWHCPHGIGHPETGTHGCDGCCCERRDG